MGLTLLILRLRAYCTFALRLLGVGGGWLVPVVPVVSGCG